MPFSTIISIGRAVKYFLTPLFLVYTITAFPQKAKADSISKLLAAEKIDTNRVRLMWQLANTVNIYNPGLAMSLSQQAIYLSKDLKYIDGESKSLGTMANAAINIGNYPRALELYFQKLQLEEKRNMPNILAGVLANIGVVYVKQEEYGKALEYYYKADAVIQENNVKTMKNYILLNLGDVYNRLDMSDSSYNYFSQSLAFAIESDDTDFIAASRTGLGHCYFKLQDYKASLINYQAAIAGLEAVNDDEILSEATLGLAGLYERLGKNDSSVYYANRSMFISKKDGFLSNELEAANFLTKHYKTNYNIDSAFVYLNLVHQLNDSINSKSRIRESQVLSTNEQLRQLEIEENKRIASRERHQQLQLLFIGIFIPGFFLLTLLLSRIKIHTRIIKILGVLSLLIFFEYLTLLLHPFVLEFTHHTPVYEILIFVAIAAILIPTHHRVEHWLIEKLMLKKDTASGTGIRLTTRKIKIKGPSS